MALSTALVETVAPSFFINKTIDARTVVYQRYHSDNHRANYQDSETLKVAFSGEIERVVNVTASS